MSESHSQRPSALLPVMPARAPTTSIEPVLAVEYAILRLRRANAGLLALLQAVADGAELAAEQVQDKRIELLEQPPPISGDEALVEFFFTFALENPLLPKLIGGAVRSLLVRRLKVNKLTALARDLQAQVAEQGRSVSSATKWLQANKVNSGPTRQSFRRAMEIMDSNTKQVARELSEIQARQQRAYRLTEVLSQTSEDHVVPAVKATRAGAPAAKDLTKLPTSDTVGVAIQAAAKAAMSRYRLSIEIESAEIEASLRLGLLQPEDVDTVVSAKSTANFGDLSVDQVRLQTSRLFEAQIWAQLINKRPFKKTHPGTAEMLFRRIELYAPDSLLDYLAFRLPDPDDSKWRSIGEFKLNAITFPDGKTRSLARGRVGEVLFRHFKHGEGAVGTPISKLLHTQPGDPLEAK